MLLFDDLYGTLVTLMVLWWPQWFSGGLIDSLINSVTPW
jgi:hypothetical protein